VEKESCVLAKNNILMQARKTLPTISPTYGVNASISRRRVGDIFSERKKWENETRDSVKWLKGATPEGISMP
jgi:hypothetical protein